MLRSLLDRHCRVMPVEADCNDLALRAALGEGRADLIIALETPVHLVGKTLMSGCSLSAALDRWSAAAKGLLELCEPPRLGVMLLEARAISETPDAVCQLLSKRLNLPVHGQIAQPPSGKMPPPGVGIHGTLDPVLVLIADAALRSPQYRPLADKIEALMHCACGSDGSLSDAESAHEAYQRFRYQLEQSGAAKSLVELQSQQDRETIVKLELQCAELEARAADAKKTVATLTREKTLRLRELNEIYNSTSWKVTAPLRRVRRMLSRKKPQEERTGAHDVIMEDDPILRENKELKKMLELAQARCRELEAAARAAEPYKALDDIDRKMERYIGYDNGYFIELGANNGVAQSNTYYFEKKRNWRGILVEPVLHNFLQCRRARSTLNQFFCCACVSFEYDKDYIPLLYSNLMTTPTNVESDIGDALDHAKLGELFMSAGETVVEFLAPAKTLTCLLDTAKAPATIDFLSLDVEGAEIEVLRGINFSQYRFKYILVESRQKKKIDEFLADKGLRFVEAFTKHDYLYTSEPITDEARTGYAA